MSKMSNIAIPTNTAISANADMPTFQTSWKTEMHYGNMTESELLCLETNIHTKSNIINQYMLSELSRFYLILLLFG